MKKFNTIRELAEHYYPDYKYVAADTYADGFVFPILYKNKPETMCLSGIAKSMYRSVNGYSTTVGNFQITDRLLKTLASGKCYNLKSYLKKGE